MTYREPLHFKSLSLWFLLICYGLISAYIAFIGMISIWVGLNHFQQDGFWMPIFIGSIFIITILLLFLRFLTFILNRMKEKEVLNI